MRNIWSTIAIWLAPAKTAVEYARRWTAILCGLVCIGVSLRSAYQSYVMDLSFAGSAVFQGATMILGIFLIKNNFWARRFAAALCILVAVVLPFGTINPYAAMEMADPPSVQEILAWIIPTVIGLVTLAWLLDPPREN